MLRQDDKELLLAALSLFREQLIRDAGKELTYAESCQGSQRQGHEKNADQLTKTAKRVIDLRDKVLATEASNVTMI